MQSNGITINFCVYECYNGRVLPLLATGVGFSYVVLLQVVAFVLAVITRKVKIKVLNDSKEMAIIIYTSSVVLLAVGIVTFSLSSYLIVTETLFNGAVMLATTVVLFFLFVPKVGIVRHTMVVRNDHRSSANEQCWVCIVQDHMHYSFKIEAWELHGGPDTIRMRKHLEVHRSLTVLLLPAYQNVTNWGTVCSWLISFASFAKLCMYFSFLKMSSNCNLLSSASIHQATYCCSIVPRPF